MLDLLQFKKKSPKYAIKLIEEDVSYNPGAYFANAIWTLQTESFIKRDIDLKKIN